MVAFQFLLAVCLLWIQLPGTTKNQWSDKSGEYQFEARLVAFDNKTVVLKSSDKQKMNGHELISVPRAELSSADEEYLNSKEAAEVSSRLDTGQSWTMRDGTKVVGKIVDFVRKDVTVQRRRAKIYVNDRPFDNLPEVYQRIFPKVVEEFEKIKLTGERGLENWVLTLHGKSKTFTCEGVILEFENGDEYAIPFFLFADEELKAIRPSWEQWSAAKSDDDQKREHSLYLQSQASNFQQSVPNQLAVQNQLAVAQLQMMAVSTGALDLWEVYMYPGDGVMGYPVNVVVSARDSSQASYQAASRNPGYVVGPVKKLSRRR